MVDSDRESVSQLEESLGPRADVRRLASRAEIFYEEKLSDQLERSVLAAVATMRRFTDRSGRNVMLLLSGGWPWSPKVYTLGRPPLDDTEAIDHRVASEDDLYGPLASTANLVGFALYPVDVRAATMGSGERSGNLRSTLQQLAASTGGVPMLVAQRDTALSRVVADTRSYYWLGFEPQRREDDAFHEIVVRTVGRTDLEVRTREGYVDMSHDREVAMTAEAALLFGDPPDALPLEVRLGSPVRSGRGKMSVPMELTIPLDEIEFLPADDQSQNVLEVRVAVMDDSGNRADVSLERVPVSGPEQPQPGQVFHYQTDLQLRRRVHTYMITVRDPLTGTILSATGEIRPEQGTCEANRQPPSTVPSGSRPDTVIGAPGLTGKRTDRTGEEEQGDERVRSGLDCDRPGRSASRSQRMGGHLPGPGRGKPRRHQAGVASNARRGSYSLLRRLLRTRHLAGRAR